MILKKLLEKGYFPKEVPPPFQSKRFAEKSSEIITSLASSKDKFKKSQILNYSLSKGRYSRRILGIPNPKHFLMLSQFISSNWALFKKTYKLSNYSSSLPLQKEAKRAFRTKSTSLNNFRFLLIEKSFNKRFELRFDIAQFYSSLYTHSITWSIMGKSLAKTTLNQKLSINKNQWKKLLEIDSSANLYEVSNSLDALVRACQDQQSIGIPVGPDTSFLIAELIGCRIDNEIRDALNSNVEGIRYFDDYYFYVDSYNEAERVLKISQKILNEYQLEINDKKIYIKEVPFSFENKWAIELSNFRFINAEKFELRNFFDITSKLIEEYPHESEQIIQYSLQRFEFGNIKIHEETWDFFLILILKLQTIDPSNLDQLLKILISYKSLISDDSKVKIKKIMEMLINENLELNHSFEVSWSLWILKSLEIKCQSQLLVKILNSKDNFSKLIVLDLIQAKLYDGKKVLLTKLLNSITFSISDFYSENWLFVYESIKKNWIPSYNNTFLDEDEFTKILKDNDVEFYDSSKQIKPEFIYSIIKTPLSQAKEKDHQVNQDETTSSSKSFNLPFDNDSKINNNLLEDFNSTQNQYEQHIKEHYKYYPTRKKDKYSEEPKSKY